MSNILREIASAIWETEQAKMSLQPVGYNGASSPRKAWGPICEDISNALRFCSALSSYTRREGLLSVKLAAVMMVGRTAFLLAKLLVVVVGF